MTKRGFVALVCCLAIASASMFAQKEAEPAKADPVTGTWTGELAPDNAPEPRSVSMNLKFDGKSAVTGTLSGMPSPAEVKSGTFDPKTGALKLQLGKVSDPAVLLVLEGTVSKGVASGRVTGEGTGTFKLSKKP